MKREFDDYAVVYDISDNRERFKVQKVLKNFGFRVQKSVFECRLDDKSKKELIEKLKKLKIETGFIKIYKLEFYYTPSVIGDNPPVNEDTESAYII
ncbi:MAG: CRISPR-associated endonuclease Cas2 [Proteobacteria bacterium]|nr:CRISPR-associated endonuclease Cas2 [Pseudomonadota bacterium]